MKKLFLARVEILLSAECEGEACDAVSETLRDHLQSFGGDSFIDWRHVDAKSPEPVKAAPPWVEYKPEKKRRR